MYTISTSNGYMQASLSIELNVLQEHASWMKKSPTNCDWCIYMGYIVFGEHGSLEGPWFSSPPLSVRRHYSLFRNKGGTGRDGLRQSPGRVARPGGEHCRYTPVHPLVCANVPCEDCASKSMSCAIGGNGPSVLQGNPCPTTGPSP